MSDIGASMMDEQVATLDLSFINKRLERAGRTPEEAERSVEEYRRFIAVLAEEPNKILVPTKVADPAWHEHILFMEKYEQDMMRLVGGRVYHYPEVFDCPVWYEGIENTRKEFKSRFNNILSVEDFAMCFIAVKAN